MNKREKAELISLIAQWEWYQGGSTSEAAAMNNCIAALRSIFNLTDDDLHFERVWEMGKAVSDRNGGSMSEEWFDAFFDFVEKHGYQEAIDMLESDGWGGFHDRICALVAS